ncbi:DEAD/DEAH box helicase [Thiomicrorhabdus arctica]|uniref:DEAD/DEAH box helicase n=1 Tax=Thiomicrorhabdus arctica TaxID=131540 RepID=UPI00036C4C21|nr:DEAD/DEAH box helicase [Thiomicrorhabdus arctica]
MEQIEKTALTSINKNSSFNEIFKKLTLDNQLIGEEKTYILSCAIIFLRQYQNNKNYTSYAELAYYIILKYSFRYEDFEPLYEMATNFGFYPISKYILEKNLLKNKNIDDVIINLNLDNFKHNSYIETYEQKIQRKKILISNANEQSYIAPTSYGKSSIILEYLISNQAIKRIGIIVPTKSLLAQTYKLLKGAGLNKRIIIHDEMYENDDSFVAVFTQERALRLINKNDIFFDLLFIDEAHNLYDKTPRSILLSRLINKNRALNTNQKVIYLSPLIMDSNNLKQSNQQDIQEQRINFNIKEPDIYEYRLNDEVFKYNRFVNEFYFVTKYKNQIEYINEHAQKKNFFYIRSPKKIEEFAKTLSYKVDVNNEKLNELSKILEDNIHKDFYCVDFVKKGFLYIHGKVPELIKEYLEYKFKELSELKYIIANTVILEGINLPIDTIFILNTHSLYAKELTNLIGRANRLNEVFKNKNTLNKLVPKIHFINSNKYNRKKSNMSNKIMLLRSRVFKDKIRNPTLEAFDFDRLKPIEKLKSLVVKEEEDFIINEAKNEFDQIKKYLIEVGIYNLYANGALIVEHLISTIDSIKTDKGGWDKQGMIDKIFLLFIKGIENNIIEFEFKRLLSSEARSYYEMHISNSHKYSLNTNIIKTFEYFSRKKNTPSGQEFYVGSTYGEISRSTEIHPNSSNEVYVNLSYKTDKELINLAIVKLKIEDDFVSFQLNKFITMMYDFDLIDDNQYNLYIYGTTDISKSTLRKIGLSGSLISRLEEAGQLENISVDKFNNVSVNVEFEEYKKSVDDFSKFEINKFL